MCVFDQSPLSSEHSGRQSRGLPRKEQQEAGVLGMCPCAHTDLPKVLSGVLAPAIWQLVVWLGDKPVTGNPKKGIGHTRRTVL